MDTDAAGEIEAADDAGFASWDTDADQRLASEEFGGWFEERGIWNEWDLNDDDALGEDDGRLWHLG